ncbi:S-layer domain-containing protein [Crinalium epipsammum PCC 9333]|uniref:S-layer domain-containing protein n=1 Tax=Crinalium epipsammum PCC 9333 TaxID=1173022 RepID=K9VY38_9CYAN|nr:S-layer homology domain-containing protein [Crinalium epipsammum]AFZ12432.1 S-layer domain-containing protein [Crinalium epipsammum PCC 9333]
MSNPPPPDPRSSRLGFDELVGIVVAFSAIGTILAWSLSPKNQNFNLNSLSPSSSPTSEDKKLPTPNPPTASSSPTQTPIPLPLLLPIPSPTPEPTTAAIPLPVNPTATPQKSPKSAPASTASVKKPPAGSAVKFSDVPKDFWARRYIEALSARGIIQGFSNGTFRPNATMTRANFASQLQKAFEKEPSFKIPNYKDVPSTNKALPAIKETARTGFLRGYPGPIFRPKEPVHRVEVLVALANGLGLKTPPAPEKVVQRYQDAKQIPDYAIKPVAAAMQAGLVGTSSNQKLLKPNQRATRAEIAAWVYQALEKVKTEKQPAKPAAKK